MTSNAVMMPPDAKWIRGAKQLEDNYNSLEESMSKVEVLECEMEFEEVKILGNYAFEMGNNPRGLVEIRIIKQKTSLTK